jgi:hypothetical protein
MKFVNSFDIFDTLLARTVKNPTDIFDIIEQKFPYDNFKNLRTQAQNDSNHTMDDIYYRFRLLSGETVEIINKLRDFELQTEMENTIPIMSNILKINHGDIFISDMYLTHDEIIKLLNYHNINPNITLYVSSGGKCSGHMYEKLIKEYKINNHTGDNYHSDITMASRYDIRGIYTQIHNFTWLESHLINIDFELCKFLRKFRLMNPYDETTLEYTIYDQQIKYNIPMLLFMCKKLADILINENRSTVLFLSRDGCLIYKLFSFLYPQFKSVYLYSSRIINNNYNDEYILYLKNIYNENECILFDLHGSFNSGRNLFTKVFGHLPRIFIFDISIIKNYYDNITYVGNFVNNTIEVFNQDVIGSLIDFKNQKSIHMPCETPLKYIQIMHNTVEDFIKNISDKKIILNKNIFDDDLFWKNYYTDTVIKCEIILHNQLSHNEQTLTYLSNKYFSDKGDNYKCSHHYTIKYQEIISEILHNLSIYNNINNIDLLEIGLNRDNTENIPSLMIWNDYFYKNINITGFDIYSEFSKFNLLYDNINIFIGDQSNEDDLLQLKYKKYDMIIDDGYHGSKHQQISFKTLWSSLKSNGYYIIEDLHYQPELETCIKTKTLFENWKNGNYHSSEYINDVEIERIKNEIESIDFYDSKSKLWGDAVKNAFVYIKKK